IFIVGAALTFLQALPVYISMFIPDMKNMLMEDAFGSEINYTKELNMMSDSFFLVVGTLYTGIAFAMIGAISIADITAKKRVSFLFFIITGFTALPDLISVIKSEPTAPLPVILMNLIVIGLFFYGSQKATE
ncbi:hypothetical protein OAN44_00470, partial [Flavobacteriales bacterium]|nr:hypothetical protein [Flavobacteriales bacterium]